MPRVPTYDSLQVASTPLRPTDITSPVMPDVAGAQTRMVSQGLSAAGTEFAKIAADAAAQVNDTRVIDAMNQAVKVRTDMQVQALQLRGRNALERPDGKALPDEFSETLEKQLQAIRDGLGNDQQRMAFAKQSGALVNQFRGSLSEHMMREQRTYEDDTDKATIVTAQEQAALLWGDPAMRAQSTAVIGGAVAARAKRLGWDDKMTQAATVEAMSPMHVGVMQGLIKSGNAGAARTYYDENSAQMTLQARAQMQGVVKEAGDMQLAEAGADKVWNEFGPRTANDPVKLFDMEAQVRASLRDNPDAMQKGLVALRQRAQAFNAQQAESNAAGINGVYKLLDSGTPMAQVMRSDAWMSLPEIKRHEIRKSMEQESMVRAQRSAYFEQAELSRLQRNERLSLLQNGDAYMAYSDPQALAGMTRTQVQALRPFFGLEATQHLTAKWDTLQKAEGKLAATMDTEDFNHVADQLGLKPFDPQKSEGERRQLGELKFRLEQVIDQVQVAKKGALTRPEKMELMRQEMTRQVAVPGWFSTSQVPVIQLTAEQAAKVVVPAADRAQIAEALRVMSNRDPKNPAYAPTDANMRRLYLMKTSPAGGLIPAGK